MRRESFIVLIAPSIFFYVLSTFTDPVIPLVMLAPRRKKTQKRIGTTMLEMLDL